MHPSKQLPEAFRARREAVLRHGGALGALGVDPDVVFRALDAHGVDDGERFVLDGTGRWWSEINEFLLAAAHLRPATRDQYALALARVAGALAPEGCSLLDADPELLARYKRARMAGDDPVSGQRWNWELTILTSFYRFHRHQRNVDDLPFLKWGQEGRNPLRAPVAHHQDVRYLSRAAWRTFRDVGLRGLHPDMHRPAFRVAFPERDASIADLMVLTGLRPGEATHLLLAEMPTGDRRELPLDPDTAKGGRARTVFVPSALDDVVRRYVATERRTVLERAQASLTRRVRAGSALMCTLDQDRRGRQVAVVDGRPQPLDRLGRKYRSRLVTTSGEGLLDPLALFVGRGGRMLGVADLGASFRRASERCRASVGDQVPLRVVPHMARHTFAVHLLSGLLRVQAAREQANGRLATLPEQIVQSPIRQLQRLLGHRSPATTYVYLRYADEADQDLILALSEITDLLDAAMSDVVGASR